MSLPSSAWVQRGGAGPFLPPHTVAPVLLSVLHHAPIKCSLVRMLPNLLTVLSIYQFSSQQGSFKNPSGFAASTPLVSPVHHTDETASVLQWRPGANAPVSLTLTSPHFEGQMLLELVIRIFFFLPLLYIWQANLMIFMQWLQSLYL